MAATTAEVVADFGEAFLAMVKSVLADEKVMVTDGLVWADLSNDYAALMDCTVDLAAPTMGTNRARELVINLDVWHSTFIPGGQRDKRPEVRRRLLKHIGLVEHHLRDVDPTLGVVRECQLTSIQVVSPDDPTYESQGVAIEGTASYRAVVRITR